MAKRERVCARGDLDAALARAERGEIGALLRRAGRVAQPRPVFVEDLEERFRCRAQEQLAVHAPSGAWHPRFWGVPQHWSHRTVCLAVVLGLTCALMLGAAIRVRADERHIVTRIGDFTYEETSHGPGRAAQLCAWDGCGWIYRRPPSGEIQWFPFPLPRWSPPGFTLDGVSDGMTGDASFEPTGLTARSSARFRWHDSAGHPLFLSTQAIGDPRFVGGAGMPVPIGPGAGREVRVSGTPAALIAGRWDSASGTWAGQTTALLLTWRRADRVYTLAATADCQPGWGRCLGGGPAEMVLTADDLIRMAESLR